MLRALRDLAERRGQSIVAEGVETLEQLEVVIGLGFDSAQGYLLGRPSPHLDALDVDLGSLVPRTPSVRAIARRADAPGGLVRVLTVGRRSAGRGSHAAAAARARRTAVTGWLTPLSCSPSTASASTASSTAP